MPFVVVTGYATINTAVQALREGADDYITKPFKIDEMRSVVSRVLEKASLAMENRGLLQKLVVANEELRGHRMELRAKVRSASEHLRCAVVDLEQRVNQLEMLNEVGMCVASELDLDKLLQRCVHLVADKLAVTRASIMLLEHDWLVVRACYGVEGSKLVGMKRRIGEGVTGQVAQTGEPVLVEDIASDPRFSGHPNRGYATNSMICVPIVYKQEKLGVVSATDRLSGEAFTRADMNLLNTIASQVAPAIENARLYKKLEESSFSTVRALVAGLEAKDVYLSGHARRVTRYALEIGNRMGLGDSDQLVLARASQLHDLGKLGVSDLILNKPARLSDDEYEKVKKHPAQGERILRQLDFLREVCPAVRHHHERPDGTGYPDGCGGSDIHPLSKIISIADSFDAMTSPRPYRSARPGEEARLEISSLRDKQFDGEAAQVFCDEVFPLSHGELDERARAG